MYNVITVKERQPRQPKALKNLKPYPCELPRGFAIVKKMIQGLPPELKELTQAHRKG